MLRQQRRPLHEATTTTFSERKSKTVLYTLYSILAMDKIIEQINSIFVLFRYSSRKSSSIALNFSPWMCKREGSEIKLFHLLDVSLNAKRDSAGNQRFGEWFHDFSNNPINFSSTPSPEKTQTNIKHILVACLRMSVVGTNLKITVHGFKDRIRILMVQGLFGLRIDLNFDSTLCQFFFLKKIFF